MGDSIAPLGLREYQKELSQHAKDGFNTVICAPTGAGKTHVAINIMLHHLETRQMDLATSLPKVNNLVSLSVYC